MFLTKRNPFLLKTETQIGAGFGREQIELIRTGLDRQRLFVPIGLVKEFAFQTHAVHQMEICRLTVFRAEHGTEGLDFPLFFHLKELDRKKGERHQEEKERNKEQKKQ